MSRYHKLEPVAFAKGGAFGGPGTGKSVLWALCIIGLYKRWECRRGVLIFDSDRGSAYLEPLFRYAGVPVEINDVDFSLKALTEDMKYASQNFDFMLIDSLADPWEEFMRSYVKTTKWGKSYIDRGDWPVLYQEWGYQFETPFKSLPIHAFWTSKPKAVYEQLYDAEASEKRGKDVMTAQKVDETASGGRARSAEFGPGLTIELYHVINDGQTTREMRVTKDRFFSMTGKTFRFKEPLNKDGELDTKKLIDVNETFNTMWSHFKNIKVGGTHREISTEVRSGVFFQTAGGSRENETGYSAQREQCCEEIQNQLVIRFPSQAGADKASKLKIVLFVFGNTVWDTISRETPIQALRAALYKIKVICASNPLMEKILAWDGVTQRPAILVRDIDLAAEELAKLEADHPADEKIDDIKPSAFDQMVSESLHAPAKRIAGTSTPVAAPAAAPEKSEPVAAPASAQRKRKKEPPALPEATPDMESSAIVDIKTWPDGWEQTRTKTCPKQFDMVKWAGLTVAHLETMLAGDEVEACMQEIRFRLARAYSVPVEKLPTDGPGLLAMLKAERKKIIQ